MAGYERMELVGPLALYKTIASRMVQDEEFYRDLTDKRMTRGVIENIAEENNIDLGDNLDAITEEISSFVEANSGHRNYHKAVNFLTGPHVEVA